MQTQNPILDGLAKAMTEAAGAADGVRKEAETMMRSQLQRYISESDFVPREEFEAFQEMLLKLREENEDLKARVAKLEESA